MDKPADSELVDIHSSIAAVRHTWLHAVKTGDVDGLVNLVTDDVVVMQGDGRCLRGRDELKAGFNRGFVVLSNNQRVSRIDLAVYGSWAIEIWDVDSTLAPRNGSKPARHADRKSELKFEPSYAKGELLYVEFEDRTSWGNSSVGAELRKDRENVAVFLRGLLRAYEEHGEIGLNAALAAVQVPQTSTFAVAQKLVLLNEQSGAKATLENVISRLQIYADRKASGNF